MWRAAIKEILYWDRFHREVSIPRTVCGGLQFKGFLTEDEVRQRFNTENGMWRAAIRLGRNTVVGSPSFNTENGMWRAAMA